jgi:hypothetical protein
VSSFHAVDALSEDCCWKSVAVPSRLYTPMTNARPLAGTRVAVKDVFRLGGIKASLNVRSFLATYGPDTETSEYVKKLMDLGAVIVGKSKTAAFAGSEKAPEYWIDFQCPFNPRADGYQAPSGSTSGGATSLAGYDWLDFSLGTDSKFDRNPQRSYHLIKMLQRMGVFGHRQQQMVSTDYAVPLAKQLQWSRSTRNASEFYSTILMAEYIDQPFREFDTMGILSRDLAQFHRFGRLSFNTTLSADEKAS